MLTRLWRLKLTLSFKLSRFLHDWKVRQRFKYLENEKRFLREIFFIIFRGLSFICQNLSQTCESVFNFRTSFSIIKGTPKLYFMHYSCKVIILFNTDLYQSAFSSYAFKKLVFLVSVFCVFHFLFFSVLFWIQSHLYKRNYFFMSNFVLTLYKVTAKNIKILLVKNIPPDRFWMFEKTFDFRRRTRNIKKQKYDM